MLRDIPRVYLSIFLFAGLMAYLVAASAGAFERDTDMLTLNEGVLSAAVVHTDPVSRLYPGALLLDDSFETGLWHTLGDAYPEGTEVMFSYGFDGTDDRFDGVELAGTDSPIYVLGDASKKPDAANAGYMTGRPVTTVAVKLRLPDDEVTDWTYVSTVAVDAVSR